MTIQGGATQTNEYIQILPIFVSHILPELSALGQSHPIITVDAIQFLMVFRSQLSKEQLLQVLPLLGNQLGSSQYVVYTFAAVCIEKILATKVQGAFMFTHEDVASFAQPLLSRLFTLIESGKTPQKLAENDYLMKSVMRVVFTAKQTVLPMTDELLMRLTRIIQLISANPSNPKFNHYTFESLASLVRFIGSSRPELVASFETALFPPFEEILVRDVAEFSPYAFQIISQMMELNPEAALSPKYVNLLPSVLQPRLWENHGNIPALVRLCQSYLIKAPNVIVEQNQLSAFLGIAQKLISSKLNDHYGFEILRGIFEHIPIPSLGPFMKPIFVLLLTRLNQAKTPKFCKSFLTFISFLNILEKQGYTNQVMVQVFDSIQGQPLFNGILSGILIPEMESQLLSPEERQLVAIGMTRLLFSPAMLNEPYLSLWPRLMTALCTLLATPVAQTEKQDELIDAEEQGYQASFAKLSTVTSVKKDITGGQDPKSLLQHSITALRQTHPQLISLVGDLSVLGGDFARR